MEQPGEVRRQVGHLKGHIDVTSEVAHSSADLRRPGQTNSCGAHLLAAEAFSPLRRTLERPHCPSSPPRSSLPLSLLPVSTCCLYPVRAGEPLLQASLPLAARSKLLPRASCSAAPSPLQLPQRGLSSNKMALITSDCGTICSRGIKWPQSPRIVSPLMRGAAAGGDPGRGLARQRHLAARAVAKDRTFLLQNSVSLSFFF